MTSVVQCVSLQFFVKPSQPNFLIFLSLHLTMLEEVDITSSSSGVPIHSYMSTATVLTPCGIQRTTTYATACYVCGGGGGGRGGQLVQNYDFISKSYFYLQFHKKVSWGQ